MATTLVTDNSKIDPGMPIIVTAYRAQLTTATVDSKGKVLTQYLSDTTLLELYNSGDLPLSLSTLHIFDVADAHRELLFDRDRPGYLLPDEHVVIAAASELSGTTYVSSGWSTPAIKDTATPGIKLVMDGYRVGQLDIKTTASGTLEKRAYGVSSYLSTFNDAIAVGTPNVDTYLTDMVFDDGLYDAPAEPYGLEVSEIYAYASDCAPFDTNVSCGDFIELHNNSDATLDLSDLVVRTDSNSSSRTSSNTFTLVGELAPDGYLLISRTDDGEPISLTNTGGYIWLEDAWGLVVPYHTMMTTWPSVSDDHQGYSYMWDGGTWRWTLTPTPGSANHYTEPAVTIDACSEGYERNPTTNRCRKIATTSSSSLTPCTEGQERNPATNRCRSIASAVAELIPCDEGYERNPATNRCRKVQSTSVPTAPFAPTSTASDVPVWQWWAGGAIIAALVGYGVWEWRHELRGLWRRIVKK